MITMISIGVERPGDGHVDATTTTNLYHGFLAVTDIVFAYGTWSCLSCGHGLGTNILCHDKPVMWPFSVSFQR